MSDVRQAADGLTERRLGRAEPCRGTVDLLDLSKLDADAIELHELIEEHHLRTQSPVAARVLREWEAFLPRFVKVMPHDYKRALRELAEAEAFEAVDELALGGALVVAGAASALRRAGAREVHVVTFSRAVRGGRFG
jgi:hypothetical protein